MNGNVIKSMTMSAVFLVLNLSLSSATEVPVVSSRNGIVYEQRIPSEGLYIGKMDDIDIWARIVSTSVGTVLQILRRDIDSHELLPVFSGLNEQNNVFVQAKAENIPDNKVTCFFVPEFYTVFFFVYTINGLDDNSSKALSGNLILLGDRFPSSYVAQMNALFDSKFSYD
jgi:hypothetical protein